MTCHLVIPDSHATPGKNNNRAEWIGELIADVRPDVVVHLGDSADMSSLSTYDKGKRSFVGRTYRADIDSHLDFHDRMWHRVTRRKKKRPTSVFLYGNHEQRIERAIDLQPELEGVIGYDDLMLDRWYDIRVPYSGATPGSVEIDGITYAHYLVAGVSGRPLGGEHHAYSILSKRFSSCTVGHSHLLDMCVRTRLDGRKIIGLVAGCALDYNPHFAGDASKLWHRGVIIKRQVENGTYDPEFVSLDRLRREYGSRVR